MTQHSFSALLYVISNGSCDSSVIYLNLISCASNFAIFIKKVARWEADETWPDTEITMSTRKSTPWAIEKRSQLIFVYNFVKNQRILMQFSLLELTMNDTCDGIDFIHLT